MSAIDTMRSALHHSEQLLPSEVTAKSETWLTRARNYPVFSRTWYRYRAQAWIGVFVIVDVIAFIVGLLADTDMRRMASAFIPFTLGGTALHLLGPAMAVWVRNRAYAGKKEVIALTLALLLGAACSYGVLLGVKYVTKLIAYGDANVEISVVGTLGASSKVPGSASASTSATSVEDAGASSANGQSNKQSNNQSNNQSNTSADSKDNKESSKIAQSPTLTLVMQVFSFLLVTSLITYTGGAIDLWYFFRQKKRLQEVLRQHELTAAQEARREAELRLSVLAAQVEPHFLFNTLAGVRSAILTEPERATAIVDHLVDYLRATIPQMRNDGSSAQARLKQQLEAASAYLGLMHARIPRLSYSVDSEVTDAALPPLMLISLVENAIKHGVEPKIGPVHVAVLAKQLQQDGQDMLELTVADNGVGFAGSSSGSGIGLANIHERLASMYGKRASLVLKALPEGGVAATILLPLEP
ncbi:sensor histidine kinase [Undibacterium pigrum]|uniref:Histidine kinase n=1 Tax=Undibacterium pigrum TaxID=401470 RepID=A0A318JAR1_9BURK|nr:histidine kinase [Undibacterium pigrum]PXX45117.1 histidine kinase [Undibacterium pigrum]